MLVSLYQIMPVPISTDLVSILLAYRRRFNHEQMRKGRKKEREKEKEGLEGTTEEKREKVQRGGQIPGSWPLLTQTLCWPLPPETLQGLVYESWSILCWWLGFPGRGASWPPPEILSVRSPPPKAPAEEGMSGTSFSFSWTLIRWGP